MVCASFLIFFFVFPLSSAYAAITINEIFPKTADVSEEWIELYNNGAESVSLDRWKIENSFGSQRSFLLNASVIIPGKGFITLNQSQYGFTLNPEGDTVRLSDANNAVVDSQGYPGILGYNTSVGRSADGGGSWVICTLPTYGKQNACPPPTPTSTPLPTLVPTSTGTPTPTETPFPTDAPMNITTQSPPEILAAHTEEIIVPTSTPTPMPSSSIVISRKTVMVLVVISLVVIWIGIFVIVVRRRMVRT